MHTVEDGVLAHDVAAIGRPNEVRRESSIREPQRRQVDVANVPARVEARSLPIRGILDGDFAPDTQLRRRSPRVRNRQARVQNSVDDRAPAGRLPPIRRPNAIDNRIFVANPIRPLDPIFGGRQGLTYGVALDFEVTRSQPSDDRTIREDVILRQLQPALPGEVKRLHPFLPGPPGGENARGSATWRPAATRPLPPWRPRRTSRSGAEWRELRECREPSWHKPLRSRALSTT